VFLLKWPLDFQKYQSYLEPKSPFEKEHDMTHNLGTSSTALSRLGTAWKSLPKPEKLGKALVASGGVLAAGGAAALILGYEANAGVISSIVVGSIIAGLGSELYATRDDLS
jgi:hypothetical protein